jgi:hypothetical protein
MKKLLVVLLFTPLAAWAQINKQCPQFTANGTPQCQAQLSDFAGQPYDRGRASYRHAI